jgi:hypothetical protein
VRNAPATALGGTATSAAAFCPISERLADEVPLAVGAVLFEAHERARRLEAQLELEAADPRVDELFRAAKGLRKSIAGLLVEVAIDAAEEVVPAA